MSVLFYDFAFFCRFLYQEESKEYKYFAYKVHKFRQIKQEEKANEGDTEENPGKVGATKGVKRKRKSRWGPQEETQPVTAPGVGMPGVAANLQLGGAATFQPQGELESSEASFRNALYGGKYSSFTFIKT